MVTGVNAATTLAVALASSTYAGAAVDITISFRERSEEVVILGQLLPISSHRAFQIKYSDSASRVLGISLFVLGFAAGPLVWGPLSEVYGRRWILVVSLLDLECG